MSEDIENELEQKLNEEREKTRQNAMRTLRFLGYDKDASKMTQEQLDARIELLMDAKQNDQKDATTPTKPLMFSIDEERDNAKAVENARPSELELDGYMKGYDALTALIPQLRPNSQLADIAAQKGQKWSMGFFLEKLCP